jgi:HlyD family secretion protein
MPFGVFSIILTSSLVASAQITVTGVVRAEHEVIIQSEIAGVVQRVAVQEGQRVEEGQMLVELRNERQKITLELSRSGLAKANALMEETRILLNNAEKQLDRIQLAADALPRKEREDLEDQVQRLRASLNAQLAERTRAEEEVRLREHELKETLLLAPFSGTVTEIHINRGDSLRPMDTPVLQLVALEQLYAELLVPSSYLSSFQPGQIIRVQVESKWMGSRGRVNGHVVYLNPTIDAASGTFKAKIGIPNSNGLIRPGMLAEVQLNR